MDAYTEQIVKLNNKGISLFLKIALWVGDIALTLVVAVLGLSLYSIWMGTVTMIAFTVAFLINYFSIIIARKLNIEFEYLRTDNYLDIDKIYSQRDRERVVSIDLKQVKKMGKFTTEADFTVDKKLICGNIDENAYYLIFKDKKFGKTLLVFSPDERTMPGIKFYLPRGAQ